MDMADPNPKEEDAEESLSLSELPLNTIPSAAAAAEEEEEEEEEVVSGHPNGRQKQHCCPSPSPSDHPMKGDGEQSHDQIFEFFRDFTPPDPPADHIIFCGKLIPFHPPTTNPPLSRLRSESLPQSKSARPRSHSHSQSESEFECSSSDPPPPLFVRPSRSLDLRRNIKNRSSSSSSSSSRSRKFEHAASEIDRNPSSSGKTGAAALSGVESSETAAPPAVRKQGKFRWHLLMFGLVKFPPEMALRDIKSRQVRRGMTPKTIFPPVESAGKAPAGSGGGKGPWGILRALSCRDDASVAVATSFGCIPQVSDF